MSARRLRLAPLSKFASKQVAFGREEKAEI
jgi:hypothetical protein